MPYRLTSTDGAHSFELREDVPLVVGRAPSSDVPLFHPTISRRHARLECDASAIHVSDLGSSNGTYVNGQRVDCARVEPGDTITFGQLSFHLGAIPAPVGAPTILADSPLSPVPEVTIVRQRPAQQPADALSAALHLERAAEPPATTPPDASHIRTERMLALLLDVSKGLSRVTDLEALLDKIAAFVFQLLGADRVSIMLANESGELVPKVSRDRRGTEAGRTVPRSIARTVVEKKVAVLTDNAAEDSRFGGQSIVRQRVRSAMCAPLIGSEGRVQGILYVDNVTTPQRFTDEDLDFLVAFSGLAAVAIENHAFSERIRREQLVRSNFERYFAPSLAARIASAPDAVTLGGGKCTVAILFSDIRGFTPLAEGMRPDEVALLLTEYFSVMVECVFRHGGTLDKFMGDALMAQWGAPIAVPDAADRALQAALDMMREMETLNATWRAAGRPTLQIGIGLNAGEVFAGNIGSARRLEFTVIGDAVNIASHLCSMADAGEILCTETIHPAVREPLVATERGTLELKGKMRSVPVYSVRHA
ncbi:MAG TPA: adenylate/guanylate cyclase domain-containing protein [Gemmatimonadaceae bacterium]